ncbi:MAG: hypothetical protein GY822_13980 [Deltaproteobacteria bacterium]|nr:hypothetical protein [Deltaproteobacteria bacterium]
MSMMDIRGGKQFTDTLSFIDQDGDGRANMKVEGQYIAPEGGQGAEALSQKFYTDESGQQNFDDDHKTMDTAMKIEGNTSTSISAVEFDELLANK